ncbi:hypothetical protein [Faecalibacillus faecis]|uniref:hypothetical protein n=1 Tax=Faecalibacillus faecis TaxID=1982628 RepID=UPI0038703350
MLKIKDNVDLKELEKFRFSYTAVEDYHKSNLNMYISLGDNRELNINCDDSYFDTDIYECIEWIYDLIQAGLVEKVEK